MKDNPVNSVTYLTAFRTGADSLAAAGIPDAALDARILLEKETIRFLEHKLATGDSKFPPELLSEAILDHTNALNMLMRSRPSIITMAETMDATEDIMRKGYRYELDELQDLYDQDQISRGLLKLLRENVYLMQLDLENRL